MTRRARRVPLADRSRQRWGWRRTVVVAVVASLSVSTAAVAYWAVAGSGTAGATASTAQTVTVAPGTPTTQLYPGGQAGVAATITNPNPFPVRVHSLTLDTTQGTGGFGIDAGHAACGVGSLTYSPQSNGGAGWTVPPRVAAVDGTIDVDLANALAMSAGAPNTCQGATFTVHLAAAA
jgi:hypothetical protein